MSEIMQWIVVGLIVAAAVVFLIRRLKPSKETGCCSGCPRAASCPAATEDLSKCPTPPSQDEGQEHSGS